MAKTLRIMDKAAMRQKGWMLFCRTTNIVRRGQLLAAGFLIISFKKATIKVAL